MESNKGARPGLILLGEGVVPCFTQPGKGVGPSLELGKIFEHNEGVDRGLVE